MKEEEVNEPRSGQHWTERNMATNQFGGLFAVLLVFRSNNSRAAVRAPHHQSAKGNGCQVIWKLAPMKRRPRRCVTRCEERFAREVL